MRHKILLIKHLVNLFRSSCEGRDDGNASSSSENSSSATGLDLFRPLTIGLRTLNMFYNWLVTTMCYYGLTSMASSLSGNVFADYALLIAIEIPAHFICIFLLDRVGRKPILSLSLIVSGVSCIAAGLLADISWLQVQVGSGYDA
jgi:MFS family permease